MTIIIITIIIITFQNRKRYGGMRDRLSAYNIKDSEMQFQNRKRYGGMRDSSPCRGLRNATNFELSESVLEKPAVRLRSPKKLAIHFGKSSVFVELARSFRFGKCLAQTASLHKPETLSILQLEIAGIITCFAVKRKIEKIFSCRQTKNEPSVNARPVRLRAWKIICADSVAPRFRGSG